jgi:hypothetical protein
MSTTFNGKDKKMKVKLAAQTLSSSIADAMELCASQPEHQEKFKDSAATVEFIRTIDRLFDLLNSRNPLAKGYKAPMRLNNESYWRPFIGDAIKYITGLKLANGQLVTSSLRKTGFVGFAASATSIRDVFDRLVKTTAQVFVGL